MRRLIRTALVGWARAWMGVVAASIAMAICLGIRAEDTRTTTTLMNAESYERLLDSLFPRETIASPKVGYVMVLRFEPNQDSESQLLFRVWYGGQVDAQIWRVKSGNAWHLANDYISRTGKEDLQAISQTIPVEKKEVAVSAADVQKWHASLLDALRSSDSELQKAAAEFLKDGTTYAILDGTRYELWYSQGMMEARWRFFDIDINDLTTRANLSLARWMNEVRVASTSN